MKTYRYLFFDLDGTLVDSALGIVHSAQYALSHFGVQVDDIRTLYPFVGPPLEDSFKEFYHFSTEKAREAVAVYRERYVSVGLYESQRFPGVEECLKTLKSRGYHLIIATSKMKYMADTVLKEFGLMPYFEFVGGRDDEGVLHTKADVIRHILSELDLEAAKADILMIGDRKYDVIGAKEVGLDSMGVLFGYGGREELETAGVTYLAESYADLLEQLP